MMMMGVMRILIRVVVVYLRGPLFTAEAGLVRSLQLEICQCQPPPPNLYSNNPLQLLRLSLVHCIFKLNCVSFK